MARNHVPAEGRSVVPERGRCRPDFGRIRTIFFIPRFQASICNLGFQRYVRVNGGQCRFGPGFGAKIYVAML